MDTLRQRKRALDRCEGPIPLREAKVSPDARQMEFRALTKLAIFTICSGNYTAQVRTFFRSAALHHPEADLFLCLVDRPVDAPDHYGPRVRVISAEALGVLDFPSFAFRYDIMELNTAVKPFMIRHLFQDMGYDLVLYLDPDIEIFRPLTSVMRALEEGASIVLTPHLLSPSEGSVGPDDMAIMRAGTYNLGFFAARACKESFDVVDWWARRLRYLCINDQPRGLFVDQRFMDLVPGFARSCHVSHDGTLNVAYWNLRQRCLQQSGGTFLIDGRELSFFHYSGFDPSRPGQLSKHDPAFHIPRSSGLERLVRGYCERLAANGYGTPLSDAYAYGRFRSGTEIPRVVRQMFRSQHEAWPDDPFDTYESFLHEPCPGTSKDAGGGRVATNLMRFLHAEYAELRNKLDLTRPEHVRLLVEWFVNHAHAQLHLDLRLIYPAAARIGNSPPARPRLLPAPDGTATVTVVGYHRAISGVGEAARQTLRALVAGGVAFEGFDVSRDMVLHEADESMASHSRDKGTSPFQIYNVNADQLGSIVDKHRDDLREDALRACIPFWELTGMPAAWLANLERMDEIWAPSRFVQSAIAARITKPVVHMPVAIETGTPTSAKRERFGLPQNRFLFFFAFDAFSYMERKNPRAAVQAFRRAFPRYGQAGLVLKSLNISNDRAGAKALAEEIAGHPDIFLIEETLSRGEALGLMASMDAILSLHRSEGLGMLVAEAMCLEKPVIATDYSATQDFLSESTGYPVEYRLIPVKAGDYPSHDGQVWADPDVSHAAWLMRRLREDPGSATHRVEAARRLLRDKHSLASVGKIMRSRIELLLAGKH